jgi:succinoglycan biosynthesis protein ExoM
MPTIAETLTVPMPLISVCVCTYQRPRQLDQLLRAIDQQTTNGLFKLAVVVVDNDARQSAREVVECCTAQLSVPIVYSVEPRQNIALARNACIRIATGDFVAFIDDDEEPVKDWLLRLYEALVQHAADGVLGPVFPKFEDTAPGWAIKGQVFKRPTFQTGTVIHWSITGTGNVLVRREVMLEAEGPFNQHLGVGGEDTDFFRGAMSRGRVFVWCAEAVCQERVPPERTKLSFQLRRAMLRGKVASRGPHGGWSGILKSAVAVSLYAFALPVCLVLGSHVFVTYLVKSCDHVGKLLATCGIDLVGDKYIT